MANNADTILSWIKPLLAFAEAVRDVDSIDAAIAEKKQFLDRITATDSNLRSSIDAANAQLNELRAQNTEEVSTHRDALIAIRQEATDTVSAAQLQVDTMLTDAENRAIELKNSSDSELKKVQEELDSALTQLDAARADRDSLLQETASLSMKISTLRDTAAELQVVIQPQPQAIFRDP